MLYEQRTKELLVNNLPYYLLSPSFPFRKNPTHSTLLKPHAGATYNPCNNDDNNKKNNKKIKWHYVTANSCTPPGYREYMNGMNSQSRDLPDDLWSSVLSPCQLPYPEDLSRAAGWPERFLNCAEITIRSASSTSNNTTITTPSPQDDGGIREPTTPANASPPTPPPATPVLPPKQQDSRMVIWFSGNAPDWRHECPPADIVMQYSHVVMDYSSPLESTEEEECSCTTWSAPNRGICGGGVGGANSTNARAEHSAFVQMARQQGRRVVLGMNAHNCLVQCDLALLASQWMSLLEELEFDGLALQFLSNDAVPTWEAAQFWSNLTLHLREQLGPDAILIHRAPETHWIQGTPYFSMMPQLAPLLDFVVPFYSDVSQGFNGRGVMTNYDIAEHYQRIVWDIFSGDSTRVVFGLCIQSCNDAAVTGRDPAIVLIRALSEAYYCHGGVALDSQVADNDGGWSRPLNRVMDTSRGCSGGLVVIPMGTPAPVEPTSPVSSPISQTGDVVEGVCCPESFSGIRAMVGCNRFHHCLNGVVVGPPMTCSGGLMFDEQLQICNWPNTVVCHSRPCPTRAPTVAPTTLSNNSDGDMINNDPNLTNLPVPIPSTPRPISEADLGTTEAPTTSPIPHSAVRSQFSPYAESILLAMLFPLLFVM